MLHPECMLLRIKEDMEKYYEGLDLWSIHHGKIPKRLLNEFYQYSKVSCRIPLHPTKLCRDYSKVHPSLRKYINGSYKYHNVRPAWHDLYACHRVAYYIHKLKELNKLSPFTLDIMHDIISNDLRIQLGVTLPQKMPHLWSTMALLDMIKLVIDEPRLDI